MTCDPECLTTPQEMVMTVLAAHGGVIGSNRTDIRTPCVAEAPANRLVKAGLAQRSYTGGVYLYRMT